ncbi:MAG: zinc carboxypeptidase [Candidatus Wallbacteria bacterium]|nr:zinc carboxypeptidase [Candidatus Wallbacteria bacterium]
MLRLFVLLIAVMLPARLAASDLYRVWLDGNPEAAAKLAESYRTVLSLRGRFTDALLSDDEVAQLRRQGFRLEFVQKDPEGYMRKIAASPDRGDYRSYAEMVAELRALARDNPELVRLEDFGDSWEKTAGVADRDLWAVGVFSPQAEVRKAPAVFFLGGIHAREIGTTEVLTEFIHRLVRGYSAEPAMRQLLDSRRLWIVPMLNPDGREYVLSTDPWWRKNRHRFPDSGGVGVDLNRNFPFFWASGIGSSDSPASAIYRGEAPFSEPETAALSSLVTRLGPVASLSFHAYGQYILTPYGYPERRPEEHDVYDTIGRELTEQTGYPAGTVSQMLGYTSSGRHDDWLYGMRRVVSLEMELGRTFFPEKRELETLSRLAEGACLYLARASGEWFRASLEPETVSPGARTRTSPVMFRAVLKIKNGGLADARSVKWVVEEKPGQAQWHPSSGTIGVLPGIRHGAAVAQVPVEIRIPASAKGLSADSLKVIVISDGSRVEVPVEPGTRSIPGE